MGDIQRIRAAVRRVFADGGARDGPESAAERREAEECALPGTRGRRTLAVMANRVRSFPLAPASLQTWITA